MVYIREEMEVRVVEGFDIFQDLKYFYTHLELDPFSVTTMQLMYPFFSVFECVFLELH